MHQISYDTVTIYLTTEGNIVKKSRPVDLFKKIVRLRLHVKLTTRYVYVLDAFHKICRKTITLSNSVNLWVYLQPFCFVLVCPKGFYGVACIKKCVGNCRDVSQCHHINGACVSGCNAGYRGDFCKTREYEYYQALYMQSSNST